jgi:hypothetical protein
VFRPGLYRRCPHAGLAAYCSDHTLVENVIVFEARVDPASGYGGTADWQLITGGFVCEGHDCPNAKSSGNNRMYGCIGIDNGEHWSVTPRSQPAGCFIWNEYGGEFEDWVLWKNPDKAFAAFTDSSTRVMPLRSLEGDPANVVKNTGPQILTQYVDGALTVSPLWPWPYEDIIKADMGMSETITEYVRRQLAPYIAIPQTGILGPWFRAQDRLGQFNPAGLFGIGLHLYDMRGKLVAREMGRAPEKGCCRFRSGAYVVVDNDEGGVRKSLLIDSRFAGR